MLKAVRIALPVGRACKLLRIRDPLLGSRFGIDYVEELGLLPELSGRRVGSGSISPDDLLSTGKDSSAEIELALFQRLS